MALKRGPRFLPTHGPHAPPDPPGPFSPCSDDPAHTPEQSPGAHTKTPFFFFLKGGWEAKQQDPTEFSLWFPGLKGGPASGPGAGRRSRGPGAGAKERAVSAA